MIVRVSHNKTFTMDSKTILTANVLDILFEGKNKDYGAYQLRRSYNKRISVSLTIMLVLILGLLISSFIGNRSSNLGRHESQTSPYVLQPPVEPPPPPPPALPPPPPAPPVATIAYVIPRVVIDAAVTEPPLEIREILNAHIDLKSREGLDDAGITSPPEDVKGSGVVEVPVVKKNYEDTTFYKVEIDAKFPGGADAWSRYVSNAIQRNLDEFSDADYGTCVLQFIVDKAGKVSSVEAVTMKGSKLAEIATNTIRKGPDWIPAQQNGSFVKAWRIQPVTLNRPSE